MGALTPQAILKLTPGKLRKIGLSRQKSAYILDLARRTHEGSVVFETMHQLNDQEVIDHLTAVKGIGVWTAHMFLIFALRRPNVLPTGDLGVRSAIRKAYRLRDLPKPVKMEKIAKRWHPYCSVAAWYLWRSLDGEAEVEYKKAGEYAERAFAAFPTSDKAKANIAANRNRAGVTHHSSAEDK